MVCSISKKTIAVGNHNGQLRQLAHDVKKDNNAVLKAAKLMSLYITPKSILVPIPSHTGDATYTYDMAVAIAKEKGAKVVDALQCFPRESCHDAKLQHRDISNKVWFYRIADVPDHDIVLIDNCVATGHTADAARKALKRPHAVCLAITLA